MIIKLLENAIVDGVSRVKGEIISTNGCDCEHTVIKDDKKIENEVLEAKNKIENFKEIKLKKDGKIK